MTGFEVYPIPTQEESLEIETFAVRAREWFAALGRGVGGLILRYLGTPRGEGGATL